MYFDVGIILHFNSSKGVARIDGCCYVLSVDTVACQKIMSELMYTDSLAIYPYQAALIHTYALAWSSCECGILSSMDFISLSN